MNQKLISLITLAAITLSSIRIQAEDRLRTLKLDPKTQEWVEVPPPPPGTSEGDLFAIRSLVKSGEQSKAISASKRFIKKYGAQDPYYPDVLLAQVQAMVARKQYTDAYKILQKFFNEFAGIVSTAEALRLKFVIAEAYLGGAKKKVWGIFRFKAEEDGLQMLDEITADYPDEPLSQLALKTKADHLFRTGDHALAELDYARMLRDYPQSRYRQYASQRSAESALASYGGIEYDDAPLIEAQQRYEDYRRDFPSAAETEGVAQILDTIREYRAEKVLSIASYYDRTDHLGSAVYYYRKLNNEFPDSSAAVRSRQRLEILGATDEPAPPTGTN